MLIPAREGVGDGCHDRTMTTTTITPDQDVMTLVNVFTVEPDRQQELVDLLVRATDEVMQHLPGFVSANIHRSDDGEHVVNYAQWATLEDFEAMQRDPRATEHIGGAAAIASFAPVVCRVAHSTHA
jgi:heme-degrading monooxygenase HmoA